MAQDPVDTVRLLITDTAFDQENQLFTDDQLQAFLDLNGQDPRLAAAEALDVIATSEVLVSKKIRTQDLQTDGPAVAAELRAQAAGLRKRVADQDEVDIFDIVPFRDGRRRAELTEPECWGL